MKAGRDVKVCQMCVAWNEDDDAEIRKLLIIPLLIANPMADRRSLVVRTRKDNEPGDSVIRHADYHTGRSVSNLNVILSRKV